MHETHEINISGTRLDSICPLGYSLFRRAIKIVFVKKILHKGLDHLRSCFRT